MLLTLLFSQTSLMKLFFSDIIRNIILWIHKGLENKDKRIYNGLRPVELAQALARLAVSDSNKEQV